jgi:hypothetical protein
VLEGINGSLKDIIEFSPYAPIREMLKSADPGSSSVHALTQSRVLLHNDENDAMLVSSASEPVQNSLNVSNGIDGKSGVKEEDILMEE